MQHENISAIVERAKQKRAEYIGSAIRNHPIVSVAVATIPVVIMFPWGESPVASAVEQMQSLAGLLG